MILARSTEPTPPFPALTALEALPCPPAVVRLGYRPALDGLRGIAILAVLAVNSLLPFFQGGFVGVDIFFVLSGFLITTLLTEEWSRCGTINLKHFYVRRGLRLLPALVVLVSVTCLYGLLFQSNETATVTRREAVWVLFYFANWMLTVQHAVGSLDHAWSLSVEEQFYFLWPILLLMLLRFGIRRERMFLLVLSAVVGSALWRAFLWYHGSHYLRLYYGSDSRADALLIGCLTGLLFSSNRLPTSVGSRRVCRVLAMAGAAFLLYIGVAVAHDNAFLYAGGFTLVALAATALLIEALNSPDNSATRILSASPLVWVGRISYSLYLWHYPVFHVLRVERFAALGWSPVVVHTVRFAAVFVAACGSFYLVEQLFLRLKKRFARAC